MTKILKILPQRFIDRHTTFVRARKPMLPQYVGKVDYYKRRAYFDRWRPWETNFKELNQEGLGVRKIFVRPIREWSYFRGDRVEVIKGPEKGKQGVIDYIVEERNWVFVRGLNMTRQLVDNNIRLEEDPFLIDDEVKLIDPSDLMPTDIEWRYDDAGERVRVSKRTERILPIPELAHTTTDFVERSAYNEQPKDTPADAANRVTFKPESTTFEMSICDEMNIKDDRIPYPMYWY